MSEPDTAVSVAVSCGQRRRNPVGEGREIGSDRAVCSLRANWLSELAQPHETSAIRITELPIGIAGHSHIWLQSRYSFDS